MYKRQVIFLSSRAKSLLCDCTSDVGSIVVIGTRGLVLLIECINFVYFNCKLIKYKVKLRYCIKCELLSISLIWFLSSFSYLFLYSYTNCVRSLQSAIDTTLPSISYLVVDFSIFSILTTAVLLRKEPTVRPNTSDQSLIY